MSRKLAAMSIVPTQNLRGPRRTGTKLGIFVFGFTSAVILLLLLSHSDSSGVGRWMRNTFGSARLGTDQPTVVQRIQKLQRLESVKFTLEQVVTGERQIRFLPQSLAGERILLIVHGEVFAGVDLGKLQPSDVDVKDKRVKITLPRAEIFSTRLDNNRTRVFSRETGLLVQADPNLESEVRAEAERQMQQGALDDGILNTASANAKATVTALLRALGFVDVELN
jgi:hypothetical protein